jgi:hypothetical protein
MPEGASAHGPRAFRNPALYSVLIFWCVAGRKKGTKSKATKVKQRYSMQKVKKAPLQPNKASPKKIAGCSENLEIVKLKLKALL